MKPGAWQTLLIPESFSKLAFCDAQPIADLRLGTKATDSNLFELSPVVATRRLCIDADFDPVFVELVYSHGVTGQEDCVCIFVWPQSVHLDWLSLCVVRPTQKVVLQNLLVNLVLEVICKHIEHV